MSSTITGIRILVASPSDVQEERAALDTVVSEVNRVTGRKLGFIFEVIWWEDIRPGFAEYPQAHINEQLGDDFDIFLGIFWSRIGTPTPKAGSGTLEEFEIAYEKFSTDNTSIEILVYFKNSPIPLESIDPDQIKAVQQFKRRISALGGVYKEFSDLSDFQNTLRANLSEMIHEWKTSDAAQPPNVEEIVAEKILDVREDGVSENMSAFDLALERVAEDEDLGLFDYIETFNGRFAEMSVAMQAITDAITRVGERTTANTKRINTVSEDSTLDSNRKLSEFKKVFLIIAGNLTNFSKELNLNIETLALSRDEAFGALSKYLVLIAETFPEDTSSLDSQESELESLIEAKQTAYLSIESFGETLAGLPKFVSFFNRSRRSAHESVKRLLLEFDRTETSAALLLETIRKLRGDN